MSTDQDAKSTPFYLKYRPKLEDVEWLSEITKLPITNVVLSHPTDAGGHYAEVFSLALTTASTSTPTLNLIVKLLAQGHRLQGFEREIPVYENFLTPLINRGLINAPRFYFGDFDADSGAKIVVLEQLNAVHCGRFFGFTSPHNQGKDLDLMCKDYPGITDVEITRKAFIQVAQLHGAYWCLPKEQIPDYIRGGDWLGVTATSATTTTSDQTETKSPLSVGEEQYNAILSFARDQWPLRHEKRPNCKFNPYLESIVQHSIDSSTYQSFTNVLNSSPHTIIHSDFYPANALVELVPDEDGDGKNLKSKVFLIDYEVISIGQGPQDLAQWMISHVHPETRLANEQELLMVYRNALIEVWTKVHGADKAQEFERNYPHEKLIGDYIAGGGKWIWLIAICVSSLDSISDVLYQHFIDQLTHFFQTFDVQIAKGNVPGPRC